jgi:hypothetical protein
LWTWQRWTSAADLLPHCQCVISAITQGGKVRTDDDPGLDPNGKAKPPYSCYPRSSNQCYEDCVCRLMEEHSNKPPWYGPKNLCWDQKSKVEV